MPKSKKIDTTLQERYGILHQLERLKQEDITLDEMDQIGTRLKKSGKRALRPLVRRLWRERNGDLISKYAYLLDFFEDEVWIDQLIQIALKRRDLDKDGKAAIMTALEGYGVDVNSPPFSTLFAGIGDPFNLSLPEVLERGEGGIISFMDEFLHYPLDIQLLVIRELPAIDDPRVVSLLEVVLWLENREIVAEALTALGKIRDTRAAVTLKRYRPSDDASLQKLACRSLRHDCAGLARLPRRLPERLADQRVGRPYRRCDRLSRGHSPAGRQHRDSGRARADGQRARRLASGGPGESLHPHTQN